MAEVKWIKIVTDIFDDEKMLLIEALPDADSIIVIWFKLLCLAGKQNNNGVFMLNDRIAYTNGMLATIFRRKEATVQLALKTFEELGMIEIVNDIITIPNWGKHQKLDQITKKTEYMREYMRNYRNKQKEIACKTNVNDSRKANVSCTDIDKDKDIDKDIDISPPIIPPTGECANVKPEDEHDNIAKEIIDYLNEQLGTRYTCKGETLKLIRGRLSEGRTIEDFKKVIDAKIRDWRGTELAKYLRPNTLFRPTNFENYLNQQYTGKLGNGFQSRSSSRVDFNELYEEATSGNWEGGLFE